MFAWSLIKNIFESKKVTSAGLDIRKRDAPGARLYMIM